MGYKEISSESLERFTHVIFDEEAYFSTLDEIERLKGQIKASQRQVKEEQDKYNDLRDRANEKIKEIRKQEQEATGRKEVLERSNKELSQIVKDRANSMRKIPNKKKHSGYLLLAMEPTTFVFKDPYKVRHLACWKVRFQTPYMITMDLDTVMEITDQDMKSNLSKRLGITSIFYGDEIERVLSANLDAKMKEDLILLKTYYKANGIKGFWEIEIMTSESVLIPPELTLPFGETE